MAKRNSYTMQDVARLAGVSVSTVSAVVNKKDIVSPELTSRVQQAIEATGFFLHQGARGLRVGRTQLIGMVIPDVTNPFFVELVRGVEDEAFRNGYELMLCNSNLQPNLERRHLNALRAQRVDGVLLAPSDSYTAHEALLRSHAPIVLMDCIPIGSKVSCVITNNFEACYEAIRYLIGLGHQRIAVISGIQVHSTILDRMEGYRKAMREPGLPIREEYIGQGDSHIESGYRHGLSLLQSSRPPSAILALNNRMALGVLQALRELGIPCPSRVSVISFDDPDWAAVCNPSLTAIEQPTYQIGKRAVELLLQAIQAEEEETEIKAVQVILKSTLRVRGSTGPPPQD